jgi:hypothetical protein
LIGDALFFQFLEFDRGNELQRLVERSRWLDTTTDTLTVITKARVRNDYTIK